MFDTFSTSLSFCSSNCKYPYFEELGIVPLPEVMVPLNGFCLPLPEVALKTGFICRHLKLDWSYVWHRIWGSNPVVCARCRRFCFYFDFVLELMKICFVYIPHTQSNALMSNVLGIASFELSVIWLIYQSWLSWTSQKALWLLVLCCPPPLPLSNFVLETDRSWDWW